MSVAQLRQRVLQTNGSDFESLALDVFRYQAAHNPTYRKYLQLIGRSPDAVRTVAAIPFLPIQFFKNRLIQSGKWQPLQAFTSSGTTGARTARHPVRDPKYYLKITERCFQSAYGKSPAECCWLALLPSYLERTGSSLILMVDHFIRESKYDQSGFFLNDQEALLERIADCQRKNIPTILLGVSFALLDLAENFAPDLSGITVMETGGMKGRRKEITRTELHQILTTSFNVPQIHSEYGATELFSQSYSTGRGIFHPNATFRAFTRDVTDPLHPRTDARTGALNLIDLANLDTISFLATDDLGRVYPNGTFEVLGRLDTSDIRGCNLLVI